jgi:REP element-mobilizing transposase RayT
MYRYLNEYPQMLLHAYCLMPNHFHLLLRASDKPKDISEFMHRFMTSYVKYYNRRYNHIGHLFQDRYQTKHINELEGIFKVYDYIKSNPLEAGLVEYPENYKWLWLGNFCVYKGELYELETGKPVIDKTF